jgi:hypothetical protein
MKTKQTRKVPIVSFQIPPSVPSSEVAKSDSFKVAVFTETLNGIKDAINKKKTVATLFNIKGSDVNIELKQSEWKNALQGCIEYYSELEKYEQCSEIKQLIDKL